MDPYPLIALQRAMVVGELSSELWQRDLVQIRCKVAETLDIGILRSCFDQLSLRHDALRAHLDWDDAENGQQTVDDAVSIPLDLIDVEIFSPAERENRINKFLTTTWTARFDVVRPPRLRASVIRLGPMDDELVLTYQETELDEYAGKLITSEIFQLYDQAVGRTSNYLPSPVSFRDYLKWLMEHQDTSACHYWSDLLENGPALSAPPLMGTGECDDSLQHCLGNLDCFLSIETTDRLKKWALDQGVTLNTVLLAAWCVIVAEHNTAEDVRFSAVFTMRGSDYPNAQSAVAMCFSVLPFSVRGVRGVSPNDLIRAVWQQEQDARHNIKSLDGSPAVRRLMGHPSAQSLIFFDDVDIDEFIHSAHPDWTNRRFSIYGRNPFAIAMRGFGGPKMRIQAWYNPGKYSSQTVNCLLDQLVRILELFPQRQDKPILGLDLLDDAQTQALIRWESGPLQEYCAEGLHHLISKQARLLPSATAVVGDTRTLSYRDLDEQSNQLATLLIEAGLGLGDTCAVFMSRSPDVVVALLAILKTGSAYVPIDASWPSERIVQVIRQLHTSVFISDRHRVDTLIPTLVSLHGESTLVQLNGSRPVSLPPCVRWLGPDDVSACRTGDIRDSATADNLAYVIFTSGSTGIPKGVKVQHRAVCNLIDWARRTFEFGPADRALWVTSLGFDLSVFDIFGMLACGGSLRVVSEADLAHPKCVFRLLVTEDITFWNSAPQTLECLRKFFDLEPLARQSDTSRLRLVFLSGDWVPLTLPAAVRRCFVRAEIIALGGATEATVWSNYFPGNYVRPTWRSMPYGRPIQNARYYILDTQHRRCVTGVPGELYIGGDVLALGYSVKSETAERFLPDPFVRRADARIYRTGDLARWWADGNIELLGRIDDQVKVRGYRIELGEVDHAMRGIPDVQDAVAVVRRVDSGENQLIAYVVGRNGQPPSYESLRTHLEWMLPEYMVPSIFLALKTLPVTPNGKVNRRALMDNLSEACPVSPQRRQVPPETFEEIKLVQIFRRVLKVEKIGIEDNFFELGGDSLSALGVVFTAEQAGLCVPIDQLRTATIRALAADAKLTVPPLHIVDRSTNDLIPFTPSQQWLLDRTFKKPASYGFSVWLKCVSAINEQALTVAWKAVVDHHEALRVQLSAHGDDIQQRIHLSVNAIKLKFIDMRSVPAWRLHGQLNSCATAVAREAEIYDVLLPQLRCVHTTIDGDLLFLFIPHIITDEFSARIVIDDLGQAYLSACSGSVTILPKPTTPFSQWARHLATCAKRLELKQEAESLLALPWQAVKCLPRDQSEGINTYAHARDFNAELSTGDTQRLHSVASYLQVQIASILVAALGRSLCGWANIDLLSIDMTNAGREALFESFPLHRSVGFFSTIHPVIVGFGPEALSAESIHLTELRLAAAPGRNARYGLMRYLHPDLDLRRRLSELPQSEIKFNYHGVESLCNDSCPFQLANIRPPLTLDQHDERRYLLNVEIGYHNGKLMMNWKFPEKIYRVDTVKQLVDSFIQNLKWCAGLPLTSRSEN